MNFTLTSDILTHCSFPNRNSIFHHHFFSGLLSTGLKMELEICELVIWRWLQNDLSSLVQESRNPWYESDSAIRAASAHVERDMACFQLVGYFYNSNWQTISTGQIHHITCRQCWQTSTLKKKKQIFSLVNEHKKRWMRVIHSLDNILKKWWWWCSHHFRAANAIEIMVVGLFANPILATNVMGNDTLFSRSMTIIFTFVLGTLKSFFSFFG